MEISILPHQTARVESRPILPDALFQRLLQLGSIQASVISVSKGQAVLSSQLGQILTTDSLDLKVGDRLLLRSNNDRQQPALKISHVTGRGVSQVPELVGSRASGRIASEVAGRFSGQVNERGSGRASAQTTQFDISANQSLARTMLPGKPVTAVVTERNQSGTMIKIGSQQYKIPYQPDLKIGQLLYLTKQPEVKSIEVRPLDHMQVLKSAVARHIALQTNSKDASSLVKLTNLVDDIIVRSNHPKSSLEHLLRAMPELTKINSSTIRQWISYFVSPQKASAEKPQNSPSPFQLIQSLAKSEPDLLAQFKEIIAQKNKNQPDNVSAPRNSNRADDLPSIVREVIKLGEQTLSHQLQQQSGVRLQQEQQQALLLNLTIPVYDNDKMTTIGLKIRRHEAGSARQAQMWDIHLEFEIGSLGPVSTHLTISEQTVSAIFWSDNIETQQNIAASIEDFQAQITRAGFLPGQFHSFHGKPPQQQSEISTDMPQALLDIRV